MGDWREHLDPEEREALGREPMPRWIEPMLATLTDERFSSPDWIFERKLDGERCLVYRRKSRVRILSRNRQPLNDTFPELVDVLASQAPRHYIVDGEIVAFSGNTTSFSRLQGRIGIKEPEAARASGIKVYLYLFDLLYLDDCYTTALPLRTRKQLLRRRLQFANPLRLTVHRNAQGEVLYREACDKGWEGLIAKRADSHYVQGRSRHWLKFKCVNQQELVIGGFTEPRGSRSGFGALLLGYYDNDQLHYAGKVGTGFDRQTLNDLAQRLAALRQDQCPYAQPPCDAGSEVHWVNPELVAQIGFKEWTPEGRLRHPRYLGLRRDKAARQVVREQTGR
jgi:DNA ligase D-like protein (predicted ligase)